MVILKEKEEVNEEYYERIPSVIYRGTKKFEIVKVYKYIVLYKDFSSNVRECFTAFDLGITNKPLEEIQKEQERELKRMKLAKEKEKIEKDKLNGIFLAKKKQK